MQMNSVTFRNVSKAFPHHGGQMLMRDRVRARFSGTRPPPFLALDGVSFDLEGGRSMAVVGSNGAGKSTLLTLIAGMSVPTSGDIVVNGRVAPLLELGSGFHPDLTGAENVVLNASLLGLSQRHVRDAFDEIVEFSGIREFINEPLRTYSNGMIVRLAFSVAVNLDPEILLVDEVLAVGDLAFQVKCFERIREFRNAGKTFVCVSHSKQMLMDICDTALWLDHGRVAMQGPIGEVYDAYAGVAEHANVAPQ